MNLNEISDVLKTSLGIKDSPVGVALFKREEDIPKGIMVSERPLNYCQMVQGARLNGESFLAHADYHKCKGGAAGLGLLECPRIFPQERSTLRSFTSAHRRRLGPKSPLTCPACLPVLL